ncbi:MAG: class I SAM-dependent methyltransferase [Nanoarchaeota archaeon]|nr:class I SAM-dependent methyltransferase [Nanoarchaeota archaeon]
MTEASLNNNIILSQKVRDFYNETPFPDYSLDKFNDIDELILASYPFAEILNRSIPKDASIIDVGTGTGQLSAFLSVGRKCVWGIDFSDSSLNKAKLLRQKLKLDSWYLKKVDILDEKQIDNIGMQFDYVLCLGVLHHTTNPYGAFKNILKLLKPNGFVAIGLYNKFGRIALKTRKLLTKTIFRNNDKVKDMFIKMQIGDIKDKERARGWWNDQYLHPHESVHTIGEVLKWFKKNDIEYYQTIPSLNFFDEGDMEIAGVWNRDNGKYPNLIKRAIKQLSWIYKTHREGGYWITFGKNNPIK